jgi:hypothetical protein
VPSFVKAASIIFASAVLVAASQRTSTQTPANFTVPLTGQEEVNIAHPAGGTGDPRASCLVTLAVDPANRRVCYDFRLSGENPSNYYVSLDTTEFPDGALRGQL